MSGNLGDVYQALVEIERAVRDLKVDDDFSGLSAAIQHNLRHIATGQGRDNLSMARSRLHHVCVDWLGAYREDRERSEWRGMVGAHTELLRRSLFDLRQHITITSR